MRIICFDETPKTIIQHAPCSQGGQYGCISQPYIVRELAIVTRHLVFGGVSTDACTRTGGGAGALNDVYYLYKGNHCKSLEVPLAFQSFFHVSTAQDDAKHLLLRNFMPPRGGSNADNSLRSGTYGRGSLLLGT